MSESVVDEDYRFRIKAAGVEAGNHQVQFAIAVEIARHQSTYGQGGRAGDGRCEGAISQSTIEIYVAGLAIDGLSDDQVEDAVAVEISNDCATGKRAYARLGSEGGRRGGLADREISDVRRASTWGGIHNGNRGGANMSDVSRIDR